MLKSTQTHAQTEQYNWDLVGLAEIRWTSSGEIATDEDHKLWYSKEETKQERCTGFLIHREVIEEVLRYKESATLKQLMTARSTVILG